MALAQTSEQNDSEVFFNPLTDDIATKLPPLEALIDSALESSPRIKMEEMTADYYRYTTKSAKVNWTRNFYLDAEFDAGDWNYWDRDELNQVDRFYYSESRRVSYLIGASLRFPLIDIVDRRNQINQEKKQVEVALATRDWQIRQVRQEVVTLYNELLQQQELLRISNEFQQYSDIYMPIAEMEFKNGEIPASELMRLKDYETRGAERFANIVKAFNDAYWRLEEIVGMKFNLINVER
ncbi:MAG: TolC family protein [Bacteroidota bacterium]|nr:TolC family protein [Bacteroidota bacterium]